MLECESERDGEKDNETEGGERDYRERDHVDKVLVHVPCTHCPLFNGFFFPFIGPFDSDKKQSFQIQEDMMRRF